NLHVVLIAFQYRRASYEVIIRYACSGIGERNQSLKCQGLWRDQVGGNDVVGKGRAPRAGDRIARVRIVNDRFVGAEVAGTLVGRRYGSGEDGTIALPGVLPAAEIE